MCILLYPNIVLQLKLLFLLTFTLHVNNGVHYKVDHGHDIHLRVSLIMEFRVE